jgi:hypothetical protein
MSNFDASTPQRKVYKNFMEAFLSRDVKNLQALIAKNYTFQTIPEVAKIFGETDTSIQRHGKILAVVTKIDVRTTQENGL